MRRGTTFSGQWARRLVWLGAIATSTLGRAAWAQAGHVPRYPRWGAELRVTPYRPLLSHSREVQALRRLIWDGTDKSLFHGFPLMLALELNFFAYNDHGLLGPLVQVGYWSQAGPARECFSGDVVVACTQQTVFASQRGTDTSTLLVLPVSVGAVYRYDVLRRQLGWPLLLHAKAGLTYFLWWGTLGHRAAVIAGRSAKGGTLGLFGSAGVTLALDGFMSRSAQPYGMEGRDGTHAGLFLEYTLLAGQDLSAGAKRLDFGDPAFVTLGLNVDFR